MLENRALGIWAIIVGVVLNNLAYAIDLMKDDTGVIIMGTKSLLGVLVGIALILYGLFVLLRRGESAG
jgi:hypothetical protein